MDDLLNVYAFIQDKYISRMEFDPTYPEINKSSFKDCECKEFYGDCEEAIPSNVHKPRGKDVDIRIYVDSDHAREKRTRS